MLYIFWEGTNFLGFPPWLFYLTGNPRSGLMENYELFSWLVWVLSLKRSYGLNLSDIFYLIFCRVSDLVLSLLSPKRILGLLFFSSSGIISYLVCLCFPDWYAFKLLVVDLDLNDLILSLSLSPFFFWADPRMGNSLDLTVSVILPLTLESSDSWLLICLWP